MRSLLPRLLATITRHPRRRVVPGIDFQWSSKLWTHNVFRIFELVFGAPTGIRPSVTAYSNGTQVAHCFEAVIAIAEGKLRALELPSFKIVEVYQPQFAVAGFPSIFGMPQYLFAIAYDANYRGTGAGGAASVTYSHTNTGSNLSLAVMGCQNNVPIATSSSATYNGVAMTQTTTKSNAGQNTWMDILVLAAPATGANNVVWTANQTEVSAFSISLTGTNSSPIGNSGTPVTWTTTTSTSITFNTGTDNSWIVDNTQNNNATATATGSGQTIRNNATGVGGNRFYGSTMTTTTAGSYTPGYSWTGNTDGTMLATEIKEAPVVTNGNFLAFM